MNENLVKIVKTYSLCTHREYAGVMHEHSKDTLIGMFTDLLTAYINDKNSSTLRELITVTVAGYEHEEGKIGYNGYKHSVAGKAIACEAKLRNVSISDFEDYRQGRRKTVRKLNGGGNFTDYTPERFEGDREENLNMLVSGFVDGRLIYILEFPFAEDSFAGHLHAQLCAHFPDGRDAGRYLRSANFDYRHFIDSPRLKSVHCDLEMLEKFKACLVGRCYKKLSVMVGAKK